jgi:hypothetical protein
MPSIMRFSAPCRSKPARETASISDHSRSASRWQADISLGVPNAHPPQPGRISTGINLPLPTLNVHQHIPSSTFAIILTTPCSLHAVLLWPTMYPRGHSCWRKARKPARARLISHINWSALLRSCFLQEPFVASDMNLLSSSTGMNQTTRKSTRNGCR